MTTIKFSLCVFVFVLLQACSGEPKLENSHYETVASRAESNTLYYSGSIQPLRSLVVTSPVDGVVVEMPLQYGEGVEPGDDPHRRAVL